MLRSYHAILEFIILLVVIAACNKGNTAWTLVELLSKEEQVKTETIIVEVRNCGVVEHKTHDCSAGTSNDFNVSLGLSTAAIEASVSDGLGIGRNSGQSLDLDSPPEGFVYRYMVSEEYRITTGNVRARSSEGYEQVASYTFHASCSLRIESIEELACAEMLLPQTPYPTQSPPTQPPSTPMLLTPVPMTPTPSPSPLACICPETLAQEKEWRGMGFVDEYGGYRIQLDQSAQLPEFWMANGERLIDQFDSDRQMSAGIWIIYTPYDCREQCGFGFRDKTLAECTHPETLAQEKGWTGMGFVDEYGGYRVQLSQSAQLPEFWMANGERQINQLDSDREMLPGIWIIYTPYSCRNALDLKK